jgi:uncharacterized delta-60 repeat protein
MRKIFTLLFVSTTILSRAQDGTLDATYGNFGKQVVNGASVLNEQQRIVILSDKKILHCYTVNNAGNNDFGMVRYDESGAVDPTFGVNGYVSTDFSGGDDHAYAITVTSTGQIILVGSSGGSFAIARYSSTGVLDAAFDGDGRKLQAIGTDAIAYAVVESGGVITVAGTATIGARNDFALARFTNTGALDATFDGNSGSGNGIVTTAVTNINGAVDIIYGMVLQTNGKIVVAGQAFNSNTAFSQFALARYNTDGVLDTGFDGDGIVTTVIGSYDIAYGVAVQSSGRIVAAGSSDNGTDYDFAVAVYTSAGVLDAAFDGDGKATVAIGGGNDIAYDVAIQSNGKILVAGSTVVTGGGGTNDFAITRFNGDGTVDNTNFGETSPGLTTIDFTGVSNDIGYDIDLGANYIMFGGVSGSGLASARLITSTSALPVHLISFTAYKLSRTVTLNWQSATERDVKSFEIERSSDGIHFSKIGSLAAAGSSNSIKSYSFEDQLPGTVNFYRLKTVNFNNSVEYDRIIVVRFEGNTSLQAFPNPVQSNLNLQITQPRGVLNLQLFDISGRLVKTCQLQSNGSTLSTYIDVSDVKKGIYLLRVNNEAIKIIKN